MSTETQSRRPCMPPIAVQQPLLWEKTIRAMLAAGMSPFYEIAARARSLRDG